MKNGHKLFHSVCCLLVIMAIFVFATDVLAAVPEVAGDSTGVTKQTVSEIGEKRLEISNDIIVYNLLDNKKMNGE